MINKINKNFGNSIQGAMRNVENGRYGDLTTNDAVIITAYANGFKVNVQRNVVNTEPVKKKTIIGNPFFWRK